MILYVMDPDFHTMLNENRLIENPNHSLKILHVP